MKQRAAGNRQRGWYEAIRFDWKLLHENKQPVIVLDILIRLCRELKRGWLTTIRFVTSYWTRHGTDDFLGSDVMDQGLCFNPLLKHNDSLDPDG